MTVCKAKNPQIYLQLELIQIWAKRCKLFLQEKVITLIQCCSKVTLMISALLDFFRRPDSGLA